MNTNSDSTTLQTPSYEYFESDEYDNELVYEGDYPELNVTDNDNYRLLVDGTIETAWTENKLSEDSANAVDSRIAELEEHLIPNVKHDKEAAATDDDAKSTQSSNSELGSNVNYSESDVPEVDATADNHSETNSALKFILKDNVLEINSDMERKQDHSETPIDAVFVPHQKQLSNKKSLKSSVEVTESTKTKEKDKQKEENESSPLKASQTMSSSNKTKFSFLCLCLTILMAKVTCY